MAEEILFSKEVIGKKVKELAIQIQKDYKNKHFLLLGILNGAYMFVADLSRTLWEIGVKNFEVDFIGISSYGNKKQSSKKPQLIQDTSASVANCHVLIVEDIIETGYTLEFVYNLLKQRNPLSIKTITLLSKSEKRQILLIPDYIGFDVSADTWVEGYGLDTAGLGRGAPDIITRLT